MIEHIEIEGFKSLEKVSLDLGPLNILVGTNASGKTNFLEALRVLQGIGYGYTVDEVFNGRPKLGNNEAWEGIRGGSKYAVFAGPPPKREIVLRVRYTTSPNPHSIRISPEAGTGVLEPSAPIGGAKFPALADVQFLQPTPSVQREYSTSARAYRMGDRCEDFAALIKTIMRDDAAHSNYTSWLKELTPGELDDIVVLEGAKNDLLFGVKKDGVTYPATVLSDGTLRFAAIAAAFFQPEPPQLLMLEEIEDGLHPTRLQLLVELLKSQAGRRVKQVIATTHSPTVIAWLNAADYRHVFLFTRNEETGATSIQPFSEVPHLVELAREQPISDLFAEGWLETAV